ncbi:unnamed protein product [uncultured bacterium]|nr:unnamed protein product [uncultured bacterium]
MMIRRNIRGFAADPRYDGGCPVGLVSSTSVMPQGVEQREKVDQLYDLVNLR